MFCQKKARLILRRRKRSTVKPRCDRISELPESLITQILSHLPTKDSVKTSVLSTRWKNLWLNVPGLDLNSLDFSFEEDAFIDFIDRFLEFKPESRLQKFKVNFSSYEVYGIKDRIGTAVNRGIQQLDLVTNTYYVDYGLIYPCIEFMPLNFYTSKTLVSLKLSFSGLENPGFVSLPCLKIMYLCEVRWHSSGTMNLEKLLLGCPVLEELVFVRDTEDESVDTRVRSRSLKRFCLQLGDGMFSRSAHTLEIDAPGLEYMSLEEDQFDRIVVKNLTSLLMVDLNIKFCVEFGESFDPEDLSKRNEICDFLTGISTVRHMIISHETMKALELYSKVGQIPIFNHLSRLEAEFPSSLILFSRTFLHSFPNLKHLIVNFVYLESEETEMKMEMNIALFEFLDAPKCLISTLEHLEIKGLFALGEKEMELIGYFLNNSAVLKKLTVSFIGDPDLCGPESDIYYKELKKFRKLSRRCSIVVAWEAQPSE